MSKRGSSKSFSERAAGRDDDAFLGLRNYSEPARDVAALLFALPAAQHHDMFCKAFETRREGFKVRGALGDHDRGPPSFKRLEDIVENQ